MSMENLKTKDEKLSSVDNLMWTVTRQMTKKKKVILDSFDLTCSQYDILNAISLISKKNEEIIQVNLSEKAHIDPMTTSTILRNLQRKGFIRRERGLINTRTVEVRLTESGAKTCRIAQRKIDKMREEIYQNIDQHLFSNQLLKLVEKLNK